MAQASPQEARYSESRSRT